MRGGHEREICHEAHSFRIRRVVRGRTRYSGSKCAGGHAASDNADHNGTGNTVNHNNRADNRNAADVQSLHAGAWHDDKRRADA
jgi:hypothetical protein